MKKILAVAVVLLMAGSVPNAYGATFNAYGHSLSASSTGISETTSLPVTLLSGTVPTAYQQGHNGTSYAEYSGYDAAVKDHPEILTNNAAGNMQDHPASYLSWQFYSEPAQTEYLKYEPVAGNTWSITEFQTWNSKHAGRDNLNFDIYVTTTTQARTLWATYKEGSNGDDRNGLHRVDLTVGSTPLTNVTAVEWSFPYPEQNGWMRLSELGLTGTLVPPPPVPEPAGLGLIGVALLALRKRRS